MTQPTPRRRLLTFALSGLCAVLAVLAFVPPPPADAPERAGKVKVAPIAASDLSNPIIRTGAARGPAFQRPIFVPSRRLPEQAESGSGDPAAVAGMKLNAVFLGPGIEKALVTTARDGDGQWLMPGQAVEGWRVEEIRAESIVLAGAGGRRELQLEKPEAAPVRSTRNFPGKRPMPPKQNGAAAQPSPDTGNAQAGQKPDQPVNGSVDEKK